MFSFIQHKGLMINEQFLDVLRSAHLADFDSLMHLETGQCFKKNRFRSIVRIEEKDRIFFLKRHYWPWNEKIKSLLPWGRKEDAKNEWESMRLLHELGFHTMVPVAFGEKRKFGLPYLSLTLTENISDAEKLETYLPKVFAPPLDSGQVAEKRELIINLAGLARDFHAQGLNHQDFYLGHLFIRPSDKTIFIVDLQRVHRRNMIRRHDVIKDLAEIAYSAERLRLFTKTDFVRFAHVYLGRNRLDSSDRKLLRKIMAKKGRIARHDAKLQMRKNKGNPQ